MNTDFNDRLKGLAFLSCDERTSAIFFNECERVTSELSALASDTTDRADLSERIECFKAILDGHAQWLEQRRDELVNGHVSKPNIGIWWVI